MSLKILIIRITIYSEIIQEANTTLYCLHCKEKAQIFKLTLNSYKRSRKTVKTTIGIIH